MKTEIESKDLLARYGIETTRPHLATSAREAETIVAALGRPCALKIVSPDIVHKADAGGVRLFVDTGGADEAYTAIMGACAAHAPEARLDGVLVEEMVPNGLEVFIGARVDPQYGPVILLGPGGSGVEGKAPPRAALLPLTSAESDALVDRAFPGTFAANGGSAKRARIVDYVMALGGPDGLMMREAIAELDVNPVIVGDDGAIAVDAVAGALGPDETYDVDAKLTARRERLGNMAALFEPKAIAIVGASTRTEKLGYRLVKNLVDFGFAGEIYPIHPTADEICGRKVYSSVAALPQDVDRAYIAVSSRQVPETLAACRDRGVAVAQVLTAGFSEYSGDAGDLEADMLDALGPVRMVGPNCIGTFSASARMPLTAPRFNPVEPGAITFFSQSGTFACDVVRRAEVMGVPVGRSLSCGNCADLDLVDFLLTAEADSATEIVAFYIETLRDPGLFFRLAATITKPVIILRGGSTEQGLTAASSHTAALATDSVLWDAAREQSGVVEVHNIDDLMDVLMVLAAHGRIAGNRLAIFGSGGGVSVTSSDAAARCGMVVPPLSIATVEGLARFGVPGTSVANPIDIPVWGLREGDHFILEEIVNLLKDEPGINSIIVYVETGSIMDFADSDEHGLAQLHEISASVERARPDGYPVSLVLRTPGDRLQDDFVRDERRRLLSKGIAVFASTARAVRAHSRLWTATKGKP